MRLAKALIRLRVCAGWSEALPVAHTTLLEFFCHGYNINTLGQRCRINLRYFYDKKQLTDGWTDEQMDGRMDETENSISNFFLLKSVDVALLK